MSTTTVTRQELIDGATDLETIEAIANSSALTYATRTGGTVKTMAGVRAATKYDVPVTFTSSISVTSETQTVSYNSVIYAPIPSELPFTTTGSFSSSQWYPIQFEQEYLNRDSVAEMTDTSATPKASLTDGQLIRIKGYYTTSDGGQGAFEWDASSTATANGGTIIAHDDGGTGRFIRVYDGALSVKYFGAKGDNSNDDTSAIQATLTAAGSGGSVYFPDGTYKVTSEIELSNSIRIFGNGATIDGSTGTYTSGKAVINVTGTLTQIEDLGSNASKGDGTLTFTGAPTTSANDVLLIYNSTDSSWSGHDTIFRAGEFCKVHSVSGSVASIFGRLYDAYITTAVDVYKLTKVEVSISGITVKTKNSTNDPTIKISLATNVFIDNLTMTDGYLSNIIFDRCYNVRLSGIESELFAAASGYQYGLSIDNCQNVSINNMSLFATRHGLKLGGSDVTGGVTNRQIKINNCNIENLAASSVHSADMHGNCEDVIYRNCIIKSGAALAGKSVGYEGCHIYGISTSGVCVLGTDILGGVHYVNNCVLYTDINTATSDRGIIYLTLDANTTEDFDFSANGNKVVATNQGAAANYLKIDQNGGSSNVNVQVGGGTTLDVNDLGSIVKIELLSGTAASEQIIVDGVSCNVSGAYLLNPDGDFSVLSVLRLQEQVGVYQDTTTASSSIVSSAIGYYYFYPRTPAAFCAVAGRDSATLGFIGGALAGIAKPYNVDVNDIQVGLYAEAAGTFAASTDFDINWSVSIKEI